MKETFAVGHIALGYLTGKATSRLSGVKINLPLLFLASIVPDIDLILGIEHRGPTHSLIVYAVVFLPVFWLYGKQAVPFFGALAQHSLLGDLLTGGGVQMLWPVVNEHFGAQLRLTSALNISLEWAGFLIFIAFLWKTRDVMSLFQHHPFNLLLTVPVITVILPAFMSFPMGVPVALIVPHLILLGILAISIIADLRQISKLALEGFRNKSFSWLHR